MPPPFRRWSIHYQSHDARRPDYRRHLQRPLANRPFFRFIKQNLKFKSFLGNLKNAVLSQVYVKLIAYLLLAYQKFMSKIGLSHHYLARLVQRNLFRQGEILELVEPKKYRIKSKNSM